MASEQDNDGIVWKKPAHVLTQTSDEDVWDDTALIKAYDRAVAQLKGQALSTSSSHQASGSDNGKRKKKKKKSKANKKPWKVGSECLAVFSEDGLFYEATILSLHLEARTAFVRYNIYDNEEEVDFDQMLPVDAKKDMQYVSNITCPDGNQSNLHNNVTKNNTKRKPINQQLIDGWRVSDICLAPDENGRYQQAVINSFLSKTQCNVTFIRSRKRREVSISLLKITIEGGGTKEHWRNFANLPSNSNWHPPTDLPFPPHLSSYYPPPFGTPGGFSDWGSFHTSRTTPSRIPPFPPPPPMLSNDVINGDEEALANMLMSWYMNGYHTGFYQGLQQNKKTREPNEQADSSTIDSSV